MEASKMEDEMNEEVGWCVLCCDAANPSNDEDERGTTINKFWKQISTEDNGNCNELAVCVDCLASMAIATEERENAEKIEVEVRSLQRQVLELLKELQGCMSGYLNEMRIIEEKIQRSTATSGLVGEKGAGRGRKRKGLNAVHFRDGIVNEVKDLNQFQDQLSLKVNPVPDNDSINLTTAPAHLPTPSINLNEVEAEDREEPPDFDDDDPPYSPDYMDEVEAEVEEKPKNMSAKRRSPRRSAAGARLSAELPEKPNNKRQDSKKSHSKKKERRVKKKGASPPEKIDLPSWIKETPVTTSRNGSNRLENRRHYLCELCQSFDTRHPFTLEQHLREHEQEALSKDTPKSFTCTPCNLSWSLKQLYDYHMSCHDNVVQFRCCLCNRMNSPLELATHLKEEHDATQLFQCDNCLFCCSTRDKYLEHLKCFHIGTTVIMSCDLCPEKFNTRKVHWQHLYEKHKAIEKLECGMEGCTKTFLDPGIRKVHHYGHRNPFSCQQCFKRFSTSEALEEHQPTHTTVKIWECGRCKKICKSRMLLNAHKKFHDREDGSGPVYQCHLCEKSFLVKLIFDGHLKMHQGLGYTCDQCGAKFPHKQSLKHHISTHEPEPKFFCEHCGRGFKCLVYLKNHVKTQHENSRKFECKVCLKICRDSSGLRKHSVVHTGAKPFQCNICGTGFTQNHALRRHKKHIHHDELDADIKYQNT